MLEDVILLSFRLQQKFYFIFAIILLFGSISYSVPALGKSEQPITKPQDGASRGRPTRRQGTGSRNGEFISVSIPYNLPPLEVNKNYRWHFKIYCHNAKNQVAKEPSDFVFGSMRMVALKPELESQLKTINTPLERINFYKQNGIW